MKVTYIEEIEPRTAFSRKMYCPACGSHCYEIVRSNKVEQYNCGVCIDTDLTEWFIRCEECEAEGVSAPTRDLAIANWKRL